MDPDTRSDCKCTLHTDDRSPEQRALDDARHAANNARLNTEAAARALRDAQRTHARALDVERDANAAVSRARAALPDA